MVTRPALRVLVLVLLALVFVLAPILAFAQPSAPPYQMQYDGGTPDVAIIGNVLGPLGGACVDNVCTITAGTWQKQLNYYEPNILNPVTLPTQVANRVAAFTVLEVCCEVDDATDAVVQLKRDDGSPANILASDLSCAAAIGSGCSSSFAGSEASIAVGQNLDFQLVTNTKATRVNVTIKYSLP